MAWATADEALRRAQQATRLSVGALLGHALTLEERESLVAPLYSATWRPSTQTAELHGWERAWFAEALPPPPATILVGGAGSGREVAALVQRGYTVDAFEPAESLQPALQRAGAQRCWVAGYRDLLHGVAGLTGPYDALLFGWGSLHHILDVSARAEIWRAAHQLAPRGPLLASFWLDTEGEGIRPSAGGRVVDAARRVGAALGARRGAQPATAELFDPRFGFARPMSRPEIESVARQLGRRARWCAAGAPYPHVTL